MSSKLCPYCMQMAETEICPHCGKNINYQGVPSHLPAGYVVQGKNPYVIGAALGQGGFGITYIALDMTSGQRVAIKEYFPTFCCGRSSGTISAYPNQDDVFLKGRARFLDEARVLKSLSDLKSIVNVLDFFEFNNSAYLVMEYLDGISLKDHMTKEGKLPAQPFLEQIRPMMDDIERMHQRGVVHRDIAPDNIILLPDGHLKLIDFGAARSFVGDKSMTVVVKKGFAPVEQYFSTGTTASSDVYALAATIYYCITGTVPIDSAQRQADAVPLAPPSTLGADITPVQEQALFKALEVLQKDRTKSILELVHNLYNADACDTESPVAQEDPQPVPQTGLHEQKALKKKLPLKILLPAAALLVLLVVIILSPATTSGKYFAARASLRQGNYGEAATAFAELGDYFNSPALYEEATYCEAEQYFLQMQYDKASPLFQELGNYKDSHSYWERSVYAEAEALLTNMQYSEALDKLSLIPNYEKTYNLMCECYYQRGSARLDSKLYNDAYADLTQIPESYKQTASLLRKTKLDWAKQFIDNDSTLSDKLFLLQVTFTASESEELYDYIISKDFYGSAGVGLENRSAILRKLVGNYPLRDSLCKLFDEFTTSNAVTFIKENRTLFTELWDIPVAQNIITEDWNICFWMFGKWKSSKGTFIRFYEKDNDGSVWCEYSLPWTEKPTGTAHWTMDNMVFYWTDEDYNKLATVYRFTLTGPNTMEVYCYKDQTTYTVTRS